MRLLWMSESQAHSGVRSNLQMLVRSLRLIVAGLACVWTSWAVAQDTPVDATWQTDGSVYASLKTSDSVFLGGSFTSVFRGSPNGVPLSTTTGFPLDIFPEVDGGEVNACIADGSGGWFIGGSFTQVGGFDRNYIAHILSTGALDTAWNANADDVVWALALSGTKLCVGGDFQHIGGLPRNHIATLYISTGGGTTWKPEANNRVTSLQVSPNTPTLVVVAGWFTNIANANRHELAVVDLSSNTALPWDPSPNLGSRIYAIALTTSTIYVGGDFTTIGGQPRNRLAAFSIVDGTILTWNPNITVTGASGAISIEAMAVSASGSTLYVGGSFGKVGATTRNNVAAVDATSGSVTSWNPNSDGRVCALAVLGTTVYAGGWFGSIGGQSRQKIVALDSTGTARAWRGDTDGYVNTLAVSGSTIYVGGQRFRR